MEELKLDKEISSEDENISTWHLGRQKYQADSKSFLFSKGNGDAVRKIVEFNGFMTEDDSVDGRESTELHAKSPLDPRWREDRTGLYTNVGFMDVDEMPERAIFPQEGNYQVVKGICIDREIPSQNTCSIEDCELDHDIISCLLNSDGDTDSKSTKEAANAEPSISDATESFSEHNCLKDVIKLCGSMNFSMETKGDFDASIDIADGGLNKKCITGRLLVVTDSDTNCSHVQLSSSTEHRGERKYNEVPSKEATSTVSSATEAPLNNSHAVEAASETELEIRSINYDSASLVTSINDTEGSSGNEDCQSPLKIVNISRLEDGMSESLQVSSQTYDHGESSFSAIGPFSGPIVYSGPILYSGSTSLRSNSSNSIRSFAFPVLSSELNGSPVRMAEADRRHLKKHKRWRMVFLCCKF